MKKKEKEKETKKKKKEKKKKKKILKLICSPLRGYCTSYPKLACFVRYLKSINIFFFFF